MFILEGNIGTGKSTLINILKEELPDVVCRQEPVEAWQKTPLGGSLLEDFYKDTKRWAYTMENYTLIQRIKETSKHKRGKFIAERSIFSGFYVFAKNGYLNGSMSQIEWQVYNQWFNFFVERNCVRAPIGFIYLKSDPEVCYKRVQKRSRSEESALTLDYLKDISRMHDEMLLSKTGLIKDLEMVPVLVLDADQEFEVDSEVKKQFVQAIKSFVDKNTIVPAKKTTWEVDSKELEITS